MTEDSVPRVKRTVVHRGAPEVVGGIVERLRAEGVDAIEADGPNFIVRLISFGTYRVGVWVPDAEVGEARAILARWDAESAESMGILTGQLRRQVGVALIPTVLGGAWALTRPTDDRLLLLALVLPTVFLGSFLAVAVVSRLRSSAS